VHRPFVCLLLVPFSTPSPLQCSALNILNNPSTPPPHHKATSALLVVSLFLESRPSNTSVVLFFCHLTPNPQHTLVFLRFSFVFISRFTSTLYFGDLLQRFALRNFSVCLWLMSQSPRSVIVIGDRYRYPPRTQTSVSFSTYGRFDGLVFPFPLPLPSFSLLEQWPLRFLFFFFFFFPPSFSFPTMYFLKGRKPWGSCLPLYPLPLFLSLFSR